MGFFKSIEEKVTQQEKIIWNNKEFEGRVGQIHQGLSSFGLWGVKDNGKTKFHPTLFKIYDDKILIERNKQFIYLSDIEEIFRESVDESIIVLKTGDTIPIKGKTDGQNGGIGLIAFVNILNELIEEYEQDINNDELNENNDEKISGDSEDKFDKLIKLGEMYDKGLLSDEEFSSLKQELLS